MVEWLSNDLMFVYPCKPKVCHCCHDVILGRQYTLPMRIKQVQTYQDNKPFSHPVIIPLLRSLFFVGANSHYLRHQDIFISSISSRPSEREVPMVMLALVCASVRFANIYNISGVVTRELQPIQVYNSICKYETGAEKDVEFSHDTSRDIYEELLHLLQQIKSLNPNAYHTLTVRILNECTYVNSYSFNI